MKNLKEKEPMGSMSEVTRKVYEITEDLRRDLLSGKIKEIKSRELDGLYGELFGHYKKNLSKIESEVKGKKVRIQYYGPSTVPINFVEFSKKMALYADVLLFHDPFEVPLYVSHKISSRWLTSALRNASISLENLRSLAEKGMLALFPAAIRWNEEIERGFGEISMRDAEIIKMGISEVDIKNCMEFNKIIYSPEEIERRGGLRNTAVETLTVGCAVEVNKALISSKYFNSELATDSNLQWKGFNSILEKRSPKTSTSINAQALGSIELPFLQDANFKTILNVREEHADVFETWREGWRDACSGLERITDSGEFNEELKRIRFDIIDPNLKKIDKWRGAVRPLGGIFKGLGAVPVTLGAFFGNLSLGLIGAAFVEPLALEYGKDLARWLIDNAMRRNFVYFLWKVKEAS